MLHPNEQGTNNYEMHENDIINEEEVEESEIDSKATPQKSSTKIKSL